MSTAPVSDRRHWPRDRIGLSLNVLLLRTGMRALGCRLLDISKGGAAIALPPASSELIEKGYTPDIKVGDEFDILCSIETDNQRKNFQFPARVGNIQDDVIGVKFTKGDSPVDDLVKLYLNSRTSQTQDASSSRSISDESLSNADDQNEESLLSVSASRSKASLGLHMTSRPPRTESNSRFSGRLNLLVIGILLAGLGIYFYHLQQQLSEMRAAVLAVSGQVADYNNRIEPIDSGEAAIQQINDRLELMSASMAKLQEQIDKVSVATAATPAESSVESAGPVTAAPMATRAEAAAAQVADNQPVGSPIRPAQTAKPAEQQVANPTVTSATDASRRGMKESNTWPRLFTITADPVNVREEPGTEFPIVFTLSQGDRVAVLSTRGIWLRVEAQDRRVGWVSSTYARPVE